MPAPRWSLIGQQRASGGFRTLKVQKATLGVPAIRIHNHIFGSILGPAVFMGFTICLRAKKPSKNIHGELNKPKYRFITGLPCPFPPTLKFGFDPEDQQKTQCDTESAEGFGIYGLGFKI